MKKRMFAVVGAIVVAVMVAVGCSGAKKASAAETSSMNAVYERQVQAYINQEIEFDENEERRLKEEGVLRDWSISYQSIEGLEGVFDLIVTFNFYDDETLVAHLVYDVVNDDGYGEPIFIIDGRRVTEDQVEEYYPEMF